MKKIIKKILLITLICLGIIQSIEAYQPTEFNLEYSDPYYKPDGVTNRGANSALSFSEKGDYLLLYNFWADDELYQLSTPFDINSKTLVAKGRINGDFHTMNSFYLLDNRKILSFEYIYKNSQRYNRINICDLDYSTLERTNCNIIKDLGPNNSINPGTYYSEDNRITFTYNSNGQNYISNCILDDNYDIDTCNTDIPVTFYFSNSHRFYNDGLSIILFFGNKVYYGDLENPYIPQFPLINQQEFTLSNLGKCNFSDNLENLLCYSLNGYGIYHYKANDSINLNSSSNKKCETKLINFPYNTSLMYTSTGGTYDFQIQKELFPENNNNTYQLKYTFGNKEFNILIKNIEGFIKKDRGQNGLSFDFNSLDYPFEDPPKMIISSDTSSIDYFTIRTSLQEDINPIKISDCSSYYSNTFSDLQYGENIVFNNSVNCLIIEFEKSYFNDNKISFLDFGEKNIQIVESEVCYNTEDENDVTLNGKKVEQSEFQKLKNGYYDPDNIFDFKDINPNINITNTGSITFGSIQNPQNIKNGTCEMFDENGNFIYYSNGNVNFQVSLESFEFLNFGFIDLRGYGEQAFSIFTTPLNSIISIVGIVTPFGEESRDYCILGTVITYENHKLFKNTDLYNKSNFIIFVILLAIEWFIFYNLYKIYSKKSNSKKED